MKKLLLILAVTLGLATSVHALDAGDKHTDPFKVMTRGKVIGQIQGGHSQSTKSWVLLAYQGELSKCELATGLGYKNWYSCILLEPKIK